MLLDEIDLDVLDARGPAVEPKDLICELDAFLGCDIVQLLTSGAGACRDVLRTELPIETTL
jgi:hypothetical protein